MASIPRTRYNRRPGGSHGFDAMSKSWMILLVSVLAGCGTAQQEPADAGATPVSEHRVASPEHAQTTHSPASVDDVLHVGMTYDEVRDALDIPSEVHRAFGGAGWTSMWCESRRFPAKS